MSAIIRRRSTNSADVRQAALRDLDLSSARNILDLGCGFGFMAEALAGRVAPEARMVGVDVWPSNEQPFLTRAAANGRKASFTCMRIDAELPWPDGSFDLVVCSYSLYFFEQVLPEVARILAPQGLFVTITHQERNFIGMLQASGTAEAGSELLSLTRRFSAENGPRLLGRWFGQVDRVDYHNSLCFKPEHVDEMLTCLRFKLPLLVPGAKPGDDLPGDMERYARNWLTRQGEVVVEKNDVIFRCRKPLGH